MRTGRPIPPLTITNEERETLERWARRPTTGQAVAQRVRLILSCATGWTNTRVAHDLRVTKQTVGKWRTRFLATGLLDEPWPGAPRTVSDADVERVLTRTLETRPADATHWSIQSMAQVCGLSRSTVNRIWHAFALQPSDRDVQAVEGSAVHREGPRHRWAVSQSAGPSPRVVRR